MDTIQDLFTRGPAIAAQDPLRAMLLALLLSFVLGHLIALVYKRTHSGLSYSRSFTESLVLLTMVVSLVMFVIGDNIVTAFGLIGALAIIRFRNVLKDTRDTFFVFFALVIGMALGSQRFGPAIFGTAALLLTTLYLGWIRIGSNGLFDGHLSFRLGKGGLEESAVRILQKYCRRFNSLTVRHGNDVKEYVFVVCLRDTNRGQELLEDLERLNQVDHASLVLQDELSEV